MAMTTLEMLCNLHTKPEIVMSILPRPTVNCTVIQTFLEASYMKLKKQYMINCNILKISIVKCLHSKISKIWLIYAQIIFFKTKFHTSDLSSSSLVFCSTLLAISPIEKTSLVQNTFPTHLAVHCWIMEKQFNQSLKLNGSSEYRNAVYYFGDK